MVLDHSAMIDGDEVRDDEARKAILDLMDDIRELADYTLDVSGRLYLDSRNPFSFQSGDARAWKRWDEQLLRSSRIEDLVKSIRQRIASYNFYREFGLLEKEDSPLGHSFEMYLSEHPSKASFIVHQQFLAVKVLSYMIHNGLILRIKKCLQCKNYFLSINLNQERCSKLCRDLWRKSPEWKSLQKSQRDSWRSRVPKN